MSIQFLIGLFTHEDVNANIEPPIVEQQAKPTVVIDPGHGGYDNGAVSYERYIKMLAASAATEKSPDLSTKMSRFSELRNELNREIVKDEKERDQDQINKLDEELRTLYEAITTAPEMVAYNQAKAELESALNFISQIVSGSANGQDPDLIEQQVSCSGSCSSCGGCH